MCAKLLQSCPTLCNPVDYSPPGFSIYGILQERILAVPRSRGIFPTQGLNPGLLCFLHCRWIFFFFLTVEPQGSPSFRLGEVYFAEAQNCGITLSFSHPTTTSSSNLVYSVFKICPEFGHFHQSLLLHFD